nr:MAG TPA: aminolevulinic acid synthase 2 [Caudoviricetes sp.]
MLPHTTRCCIHGRCPIVATTHTESMGQMDCLQ